jgi:hypothetical protein
VKEKQTWLPEIPTDFVEAEIATKLTLKELSRIVQTSRGVNALFSKPLTNIKVAILLQHVAYGEQREAEKILRLVPTLLLTPGQVTDYSGRTFKGITAFQYAVWALDTDMWKMILEYLPREDAVKQLVDHTHNKKEYKKMYGEYYSFIPYINALETYAKNENTWRHDQKEEHWCTAVGGAQRYVPANIAQKLCDHYHFTPPNLKAALVNRTLYFIRRPSMLTGRGHDEMYWFPLDKSGLGYGFAVTLTPSPLFSLQAQASKGPRQNIQFDLEQTIALSMIRSAELVELKQSLLVDPAQAPESEKCTIS